MNILKKMGLINSSEDETPIESESNTNVEGKQEVVAKKPSISFAPQTEIPTNPLQIVGKFDDSIMEKLSLAIEENNLKGNDFLEFMQSLNSLTNLAVDEKNKYNMVFTTLSSSSEGITKEYLVKSITHYLSVLDEEKRVFQIEMAKATESAVDSKEAYINNLSAEAVKKSEQIKALQEEIQNISTEIDSSTIEMANAKTVIAQNKANFEVTVERLENQIKEYQSKIEQYI